MNEFLKTCTSREIIEAIPTESLSMIINTIKINRHNKEVLLNEALINSYLKASKAKNDFLSRFNSLNEMSSIELNKAIQLSNTAEKAYIRYTESSKRLNKFYE